MGFRVRPMYCMLMWRSVELHEDVEKKRRIAVGLDILMVEIVR